MGRASWGEKGGRVVVLDLSLEPQTQSRSWGEGGRGAVSSVIGMGVEEAAEQVKLSGSCEVALAPLPWAPLPAVLAQLSSTFSGPSHIQQGWSAL